MMSFLRGYDKACFLGNQAELSKSLVFSSNYIVPYSFPDEFTCSVFVALVCCN